MITSIPSVNASLSHPPRLVAPIVHLACAFSLCCPSSSINVCLSVQIQWAHPPTPEICIICNNDYFVGACLVYFNDLLADRSFSRHDHGVHVPPSLLSTSPSAHIWDMSSVTRLPLYSLMLSPLAARRTISRPDAPVSWQLLVISNIGRGHKQMAANTHCCRMTYRRFLRHRQCDIASG